MRRGLAAAAIGGLLFGAALPAAAQAQAPNNWKPCKGQHSHHCTYAAQWHQGIQVSWYRGGAGDSKHRITNHRAYIRITNGFHKFVYTFDGRVDGHPYCWDNGNVMRCGDGYVRWLTFKFVQGKWVLN